MPLLSKFARFFDLFFLDPTLIRFPVVSIRDSAEPKPNVCRLTPPNAILNEKGVRFMKGDVPMSDLPPTPPTSQDFPDHWGFYLLQAINRLDDKIDQVSREQQRATDSLRQEIGGVRQILTQEIGGVRQTLTQEIGGVRQTLTQEIGEVRQEIHTLDAKFDHKIDALDAKFEQKLTTLQYWYWGTLVVIIIGFVTLLFTHP